MKPKLQGTLYIYPSKKGTLYIVFLLLLQTVYMVWTHWYYYCMYKI